MNNKVVALVVAVAVLLIVGVVLIQNRAPKQEQGATAAPVTGEVKTFAVSGRNYSFTPGEIKVKKGDQVKIVFTNAEGWPHDLRVDAFNAKTPRLEVGQMGEMTFTADKTGAFDYYCGVGNHREEGMVGRLIVE